MRYFERIGRGNRVRPYICYFGMEAEFWLNLQGHYDLALTREALAENLAAIQPLAAAA